MVRMVAYRSNSANKEERLLEAQGTLFFKRACVALEMSPGSCLLWPGTVVT